MRGEDGRERLVRPVAGHAPYTLAPRPRPGVEPGVHLPPDVVHVAPSRDEALAGGARPQAAVDVTDTPAERTTPEVVPVQG